IDGNTLTCTVPEDWCEEFDSQAGCFAETEEMFDLTSGSLTAASMQVGIILNQATAKQGLNVGRNFNLINPTKEIKDYKVKITGVINKRWLLK
ncbi:MAG: hypothetical protein MUP82_08895, partial [Candidatus Marinimicrobia bacterium]|nr:hypothetical protein [Candidatus Neomarinimicrobiota bacterium]